MKRSVSYKQDEWDFLHPVSRLKPGPGKENPEATSSRAAVPLDSRVEK